MAQREKETVMLDRNVGLAQELNLSGPERELEERAESGRMGPAERKRERIPEPEEALAAAVVEQAAEDWRAAAAVLRKKPDHPGAAALRRETERFFRSRWFAQLTDLDGRLLLERLREGAGLSAAPGPEREREAWIRARESRSGGMRPGESEGKEETEDFRACGKPNRKGTNRVSRKLQAFLLTKM